MQRTSRKHGQLRCASVATGKSRYSALCLAALLCAGQTALGDDADRLDMWQEPSHQQVFADGPVRILDVRIAPGATSDYHRHRFATVYVVIEDALVANQFWGGEWGASGPRDMRRAGATVDNATYVANPTYHRVRNEDRKAFHLVAVINERDGEADTSATRDTDKPVDNDWFLERRVRVAANGESAAHRFSNDVVLVQPHAGRSHVVEKGVAHSYKRAPAAFSWHAAGSEFRIVNDGGNELELVLIEVRGVRGGTGF